MRGIFGLLGLVVTLALIGLLVRKQLAALPAPAPLPGLQQPAASGASGAGALTPQARSQAVQQQYREAVSGALQAPRPMPDEP